MQELMYKLTLFIFTLLIASCNGNNISTSPNAKITEVTSKQYIQDIKIKVGAERTNEYLPIISNKNIALVVNQTSVIGKTHLVDSLQKLGILIKKIYAPEHGFRGKADAGEHVVDGVDKKTGLPVVSLYGKKRKPSESDLAGIDVVVFDVQDVGARFYTFISTMSYMMEACAANNLGFIVLDRPNPLGHYVDGPVLEPEYSSFVGLHQVPVVHGMTMGEYARMVNGEGWLSDGLRCDLSVIECANYDHNTFYKLPISPSPNLPNMRAIYLYPSICFFEGTEASEGRGTDKQFQVYGSPNYIKTDFKFTPVSIPGAKYPKHENEICYGYDLSNLDIKELQEKKSIDLNYLIDFYQNFPDKNNFFLENLFFDKLAGGSDLRKQIIAGEPESEIRKSWESDLIKFKSIRGKYLLYSDFE